MSDPKPEPKSPTKTHNPHNQNPKTAPVEDTTKQGTYHYTPDSEWFGI